MWAGVNEVSVEGVFNKKNHEDFTKSPSKSRLDSQYRTPPPGGAETPPARLPGTYLDVHGLVVLLGLLQELLEAAGGHVLRDENDLQDARESSRGRCNAVCACCDRVSKPKLRERFNKRR